MSSKSLQFWANWDDGSPSVHLHYLDVLGDCLSGRFCHLHEVGVAGYRFCCLDEIHRLPVWAPLPLPDPLKFLQLLEGKAQKMDCSQTTYTPSLHGHPVQRGRNRAAAYLPPRGLSTAHVNVAAASPCISRFKWLRPECSVQFSSVAPSCLTLCDPIDCTTPVLPVHHQLPEFTQIHVH